MFSTTINTNHHTYFKGYLRVEKLIFCVAMDGYFDVYEDSYSSFL